MEAEHWVEEKMMAEALAHWRRRAGSGRPPKYAWWNRFVVRDLATERKIAMIEVMEQMLAEEKATRARRPTSGRKKGRKKGAKRHR